MHPETIATLDKLRNVEWFRAVGTYKDDLSIPLHSWPQAMAACASAKWQGIILEAANQYCERLAERSRERFNRWNDIVNEVKPVILQLVEEKCRKVIEKEKLPRVFLDSVQWDILHLAMEAEYHDVSPPGFFASQSYYYWKGHFPCGWDGDFPNGKLLVF